MLCVVVTCLFVVQIFNIHDVCMRNLKFRILKFVPHMYSRIYDSDRVSRFRVWVDCSTFGLSSLTSKSVKLMHRPTTGCPLFFPNEDSLIRRSLGTTPGQDRRGQDVVGELRTNGNGGGFKLQVY